MVYPVMCVYQKMIYPNIKININLTTHDNLCIEK